MLKYLALFLSFFVACNTQVATTLPTNLHHEMIAATNTVLPPVPVITLPELGDGGIPVIAPGASSNGELITPLTLGQRAPWNGVLFNGPAVAYLQVEYRLQGQRCLIDRQHDMQLLLARYNSDIATMRLALETQVHSDTIILNGRDSDILSLNRIIAQQQRAQGPNLPTIFIAGGAGLIIGAVAVGAFVLATSHP